MNSSRPPRVVLVAGEASGDSLGAGLATELRRRLPQIELAGVAGERMVEAGVDPWFNLDELNVMGLSEVLRHLPRLFKFKRTLDQRIRAWQPDVFIGIDAPDFNLRLARRLQRQGMATVHYVAPTVWAWRPGRAAGVARSVDLLLTLFPFEPALFRAHGLSSRFVGHPMADQIANQQITRHDTTQTKCHPLNVALLPGSRRGEIERHAELLASTAEWLKQKRPELELTMLLARSAHRDLVNNMVGQRLASSGVTLLCGQTLAGLKSASVAISASGTATLEAFLLECPLVVYYRLASTTYWLLRGLNLVRSRFIALPNILQGHSLVPEFIQQQARADLLGQAALDWVDDAARLAAYHTAAAACRQELATGASSNAAQAVLELIGRDVD